MFALLMCLVLVYTLYRFFNEDFLYLDGQCAKFNLPLYVTYILILVTIVSVFVGGACLGL